MQWRVQELPFSLFAVVFLLLPGEHEFLLDDILTVVRPLLGWSVILGTASRLADLTIFIDRLLLHNLGRSYRIVSTCGISLVWFLLLLLLVLFSVVAGGRAGNFLTWHLGIWSCLGKVSCWLLLVRLRHRLLLLFVSKKVTDHFFGIVTTCRSCFWHFLCELSNLRKLAKSGVSRI